MLCAFWTTTIYKCTYPGAAEVEKTVAQPHLLAVVAIAVHFQGKGVALSQHFAGVDAEFDLTGREALVARLLGTPLDLSGDADHGLEAERGDFAEARRAGLDHALGQAVMVPQVHEQEIAMVPLAMDPARQPSLGAGIGGAQFAACVGAIGMHDLPLFRQEARPGR